LSYSSINQILKNLVKISKNKMADKLSREPSWNLTACWLQLLSLKMCVWKLSLLRQQSNFNHTCLIFVLCCTYKIHMCYARQAHNAAQWIWRAPKIWRVVFQLHSTSPLLLPVKSQDNTKAYKDSESECCLLYNWLCDMNSTKKTWK